MGTHARFARSRIAAAATAAALVLPASALLAPGVATAAPADKVESRHGLPPGIIGQAEKKAKSLKASLLKLPDVQKYLPEAENLLKKSKSSGGHANILSEIEGKLTQFIGPVPQCLSGLSIPSGYSGLNYGVHGAPNSWLGPWTLDATVSFKKASGAANALKDVKSLASCAGTSLQLATSIGTLQATFAVTANTSNQFTVNVDFDYELVEDGITLLVKEFGTLNVSFTVVDVANANGGTLTVVAVADAIPILPASACTNIPPAFAAVLGSTANCPPVTVSPVSTQQFSQLVKVKNQKTRQMLKAQAKN